MSIFGYLASPASWLPQFGAQLGLTVAICAVACLLGLLLGRRVHSRAVSRTLRWLTQVTPVLALVMIPAVLLAHVPSWLLIVLGAAWVTPTVWTATVRPLTPEQAVAAEALEVSGIVRAAVQRDGRLQRVARALRPGWHIALTITTVYGILATVTPTVWTGLGGFIAVGVRGSDYPLAFTGALGVLVLGLVPEAPRLIRRPQRLEGHHDELAY